MQASSAQCRGFKSSYLIWHWVKMIEQKCCGWEVSWLLSGPTAVAWHGGIKLVVLVKLPLPSKWQRVLCLGSKLVIIWLTAVAWWWNTSVSGVLVQLPLLPSCQHGQKRALGLGWEMSSLTYGLQQLQGGRKLASSYQCQGFESSYPHRHREREKKW
jgi:hypothetical protein